MTAFPRRSSARPRTRPSSRSPTWCARCRPAATCYPRPMSRTCTGPTASAAPAPVPSRSPPPDEAAMSIQATSDSHLSPIEVGYIRPRLGRGSQSRLWPRLRSAAMAMGFASLCLLPVGAWWIASLGPAPLGEGLSYSTLVVDRDGHLLRPYTTPEGRWRLAATP